MDWYLLELICLITKIAIATVKDWGSIEESTSGMYHSGHFVVRSVEEASGIKFDLHSMHY